MKKLLSLIVLLWFSILSLYPQRLTVEEYGRLSALFAMDVQSMSPEMDTYLSSLNRSGAIFSRSIVMSLPKISSVNNTINKILIIVNSSVYSHLSGKIERYAYDINYIFGCEVIMEQVTNPTHKDIKNILVSYKTGLTGAVLIGDIPAAWYQVENDHNMYQYREFPCDLYYMDLNGSWSDINQDGIYDIHAGNVHPEIFVGRISTANMGNLVESEKTALENYLDKNHRFWMGHTNVNKKYALTYIDKDWATFSHHNYDIQYLYGASNYENYSMYNSPAFGKDDYLRKIKNGKDEFVHLYSHSDFDHHKINNIVFYTQELFNNGGTALGYNLFCCSACRWTSGNSEGFMGGAYLYNDKSAALAVVGSTKIGSLLNFDMFYKPLGAGKTMGESLVDWWHNACQSSFFEFDVYWHYGLTILGDPLMNFYHCMNSRCYNQITHTSFDNTNSSPVRYFFAREKIIIDPNSQYIIPIRKHVIFNPPTVEIMDNFECYGTFEIYTEGCKANCQ